MSCIVAAMNARLSDFLSLKRAILTMVLVTVVPTFAPIITGKAALTDIAFSATMLTTIEVVADEDCSKEADRSPRKNPRIGLYVADAFVRDELLWVSRFS